MNCKECKDTRVYQPLTGPAEPCQSCSPDTNIKILWPIATLTVVETISRPQLDSIMYSIKKDCAIGCDIKVNKDGVVTQGGPTVLALRELQDSEPHIYAKLVSGNILNVTMCNAHYLKSVDIGKNKMFAEAYSGKVMKDEQGVMPSNIKDLHAALGRQMLVRAKASQLPETSYSRYLRESTFHVSTLNRTMGWLRTNLNSVRECLKSELPTEWSIDQKKRCMNLNADLNVLTHTIKRMSDRMEEL